MILSGSMNRSKRHPIVGVHFDITVFGQNKIIFSSFEADALKIKGGWMKLASFSQNTKYVTLPYLFDLGYMSSRVCHDLMICVGYES